MAGRKSNKVPPLTCTFHAYDDWCKSVRTWTKFTDLQPEKQGAAMFLSLEGKAQEAALELEDDTISRKDGVKIILP